MISKTTDLDQIRKNPSHYFNAGEATGSELMAMIIMAALKMGVRSLATCQVDDWFCILGMQDWIRNNNQFTRKKPFKEGGVGAFHPEVLVTAFADDVLTGWNGEITRIKGTTNLPAMILEPLPTPGRFLAFRLADAVDVPSEHPQRTTNELLTKMRDHAVKALDTRLLCHDKYLGLHITMHKGDAYSTAHIPMTLCPPCYLGFFLVKNYKDLAEHLGLKGIPPTLFREAVAIALKKYDVNWFQDNGWIWAN